MSDAQKAALDANPAHHKSHSVEINVENLPGVPKLPVQDLADACSCHTLQTSLHAWLCNDKLLLRSTFHSTSQEQDDSCECYMQVLPALVLVL